MKLIQYFVMLLAVAGIGCTAVETGAWADFKKCVNTQPCVNEALAVKNALLQTPAIVLEQFKQSVDGGDAHLMKWLDIMRDSVLVNASKGSIEERFQMQQALLETVRPFEKDAQLGKIAQAIIAEVEMLAIASELEDDIVEETVPVTGSYALSDSTGKRQGELQVSLLNSETIRFKLNIKNTASGGKSTFLEGEALLVAINIYEATVENCSLQFFWNDGVEIKTVQDCGVAGNYARKTFNDPFISKSIAIAASKLTGEWKSADDPKSVIKIGDGRYWEIYDGEILNKAIYIFHQQCPDDCNPTGNDACLKVIAQDEICYTVVKADGKVLELSLIGGTGNSNKYLKIK